MYHKYIDSSYAIEDQEQIWCILTDEFSYTIDKELNGNYYFQSDNKPDYFNTSLFNAANYNIPWKPVFQKQGKHGKHHEHAKPNSPDDDTCCQIESNQKPFINDRYPEVISTLSTEYNPSVDLCATYLWSDESATKVDTSYSWFTRGQFPMNRNCVTIGRLVDGTEIRVLTLIDTGATKPLLHKIL